MGRSTPGVGPPGPDSRTASSWTQMTPSVVVLHVRSPDARGPLFRGASAPAMCSDGRRPADRPLVTGIPAKSWAAVAVAGDVADTVALGDRLRNPASPANERRCTAGLQVCPHDGARPRGVGNHVTARAPRARMAGDPRRSQPRTGKHASADRLPDLRHRRTRQAPRRLQPRARIRSGPLAPAPAGLHRSEVGWTLNFCGIQQPWLREVIKRFLRWRIDIGHSASGMHRDPLP